MTAGTPDPIRSTAGVASVPAGRIRRLNDAPPRPERGYVLYWMTANRRLGWNFALQRAIEQARALARPLLVFEPLRVNYPWAADRFHRFVLDGMVDNHRRVQGSGVGYYPWVERSVGAGRDLLALLAAGAAVVITDDTPMFFHPAMLQAASERIDVSLEAVDSAGLLPVTATEKAFPAAYAFRRFLQRVLPEHLEQMPQTDPLADAKLPPFNADLGGLARGFEPTEHMALEARETIAELPIDHDVRSLVETGGTAAARARLRRFAGELLERDGERRNHPDARHGSGLSAWLHFGHISAHEVFATIAAEEAWTPANLSESCDGARRGWWGMSGGAEAFLDQLVTWRELGLDMCHHRRDYDAYESLPGWALETLDAHRGDQRTHLYELDELENAATHDELWNAAQTELVREGRIHGYLRMLWGKKILAWSRTPEAALHAMIELNNKYALDGRDPQLLCRHLLGAGSLRPPLGTRAAGVRQGALHDLEERGPQAAAARLLRHLRRAASAAVRGEIMMRIMLTCATGYIGGRLLPVPEETGYRLRCLARQPERLRRRVVPRTRVVAGDLLDEEAGLDAGLAKPSGQLTCSQSGQRCSGRYDAVIEHPRRRRAGPSSTLPRRSSCVFSSAA